MFCDLLDAYAVVLCRVSLPVRRFRDRMGSCRAPRCRPASSAPLTSTRSQGLVVQLLGLLEAQRCLCRGFPLLCAFARRSRPFITCELYASSGISMLDALRLSRSTLCSRGLCRCSRTASWPLVRKLLRSFSIIWIYYLRSPCSFVFLYLFLSTSISPRLSHPCSRPCRCTNGFRSLACISISFIMSSRACTAP